MSIYWPYRGLRGSEGLMGKSCARVPAARQASPHMGLAHARLARLAAAQGKDRQALEHAMSAIAVHGLCCQC